MRKSSAKPLVSFYQRKADFSFFLGVEGGRSAKCPSEARALRESPPSEKIEFHFL
jgi:hypothetical protein